MKSIFLPLYMFHISVVFIPFSPIQLHKITRLYYHNIINEKSIFDIIYFYFFTKAQTSDISKIEHIGISGKLICICII